MGLRQVVGRAPKTPAPPGDAAEAFDEMLEQRTELVREFNALRAQQQEQLKRDDEIVRAWIKLV